MWSRHRVFLPKTCSRAIYTDLTSAKFYNCLWGALIYLLLDLLKGTL